MSGPTTYVPPGWAQSVLWWKFDTAATNPVIDSSAYGLNTGYRVGTKMSWTDGCWSFTNAPYIRTFASNIANEVVPVTLALWMNIRTEEAYDGFFFSRSAASGAAYAGFRNNAVPNVGYLEARQNSAAGIANPTNTPAYSTGAWYRIVYVGTTSNKMLYSNGVLLTNLTSGQFSLSTTGGFWALPADTYANRFGDGLFDDPYICTGYAWTASDVLKDYNQGRSRAP
jgi:hypothetical protein